MSPEISVTVFTDLKDSTQMQSELGVKYNIFLREHLRVGEVLANINASQDGDEYKKNIGDSHMAVFRNFESAVNYAVQMQQYYKNMPGLNRLEVGLRVGLGLGVLNQEEQDAFGFGVNEGARVEAAAKPGEVVMNHELIEALRTWWPNGEIDEYIIRQEQVNLKGIGSRQLYWFDWEKFGRKKADRGLANLIYKHFRNANVELSNISLENLVEPGVIIWPIVPRDLATAIHRGQAEIVRLLSLLGWRLTVLISDCGSTNNYPRAYSSSFQKRLESYLTFRNVAIDQCLYLSDLYEPSYADYPRLQTYFKTLSEHFSLQDLMHLKEKNLSQDEKDRVRSQSTLNSLVPILTSAAVLHLAEPSDGEQKSRYIVLAGGDENYQWTHTLSAHVGRQARELIGVILNPIFQKKDLSGTFQQAHLRDWPIWYSQEQLLNDLQETNLGWWLFQLHCYLSSFPEAGVKINGNDITPDAWKDNPFVNPEGFNEKAFVEHIWPIMDPSR